MGVSEPPELRGWMNNCQGSMYDRTGTSLTRPEASQDTLRTRPVYIVAVDSWHMKKLETTAPDGMAASKRYSRDDGCTRHTVLYCVCHDWIACRQITLKMRQSRVRKKAFRIAGLFKLCLTAETKMLDWFSCFRQLTCNCLSQPRVHRYHDAQQPTGSAISRACSLQIAATGKQEGYRSHSGT